MLTQFKNQRQKFKHSGGLILSPFYMFLMYTFGMTSKDRGRFSSGGGENCLCAEKEILPSNYSLFSKYKLALIP